jgi:CRP-like cAMP-binding protein
LQVLYEGEVVMPAEQPPKHFCIVMEGELAIYADGDMSQPSIQSVEPGQSFGEYALLEGLSLDVSLVAAKRSVILLLASEDWRSITAGGLSAEVDDKLRFICSLQQFSDLDRHFLRVNVLPALQVSTPLISS